MAFKSNLKLDSKFFDKRTRYQAFGSAVGVSAKEFKNDLKQKMVTGPHTGRKQTRGKKRGDGFSRKHQASKRGERPAPDTNQLVNSIEDQRTGQLSAKVEVGAEHGKILQERGRLVMTEEDRAEAQKSFDNRLERTLLNLL